MLRLSIATFVSSTDKDAVTTGHKRRGQTSIIVSKMKQFRAAHRLWSCLLFAVIFIATVPARAACTNPASAEKGIIYNNDFHNYQFCNGTNWVSFGSASGGGGGGCSNPSGVEKNTLYNNDFHVFQYCNGTNWIATGAAIAPTTSGLVGWWKFDDGAGGTAADSSGTGNTGTLTSDGSGLPTWNASGKVNGDLVFNNNHVDAGNPASLKITGSLTMTAWINATSININDSDDSIIGKWDDAAGGCTTNNCSYMLKGSQDCTGVSPNDNLVLSLSSNGNNLFQRCSNTVLATNTWYFVAGTYDSVGGTMHVYINGVLDDGTLLGSVPASIKNSTATVRVGNTTLVNQNFHGQIDDARIYNRALSASEIATLYMASGGTGSGCTSPTGSERGIVYNNDFHTYQYCNGASWVPVGKCDPAALAWVPETAAEANSWSSVAYGNGLFVAVSDMGTHPVMTSPDGITWTVRSPPESNNWNGVVYANGLFVAVAASGTHEAMTSPDGINWTMRTVPEPTNFWGAITYGNGLYVAVAFSGTHRVMTSPDAITWTAQQRRRRINGSTSPMATACSSRWRTLARTKWKPRPTA
jgi:hypothetical protein